MRNKKGWITHVCWGAGIVAVCVAAFIMLTTVFNRVAEYEILIQERDQIITELTEKWEELGPSSEVLMLIRGVHAGQEINAMNWQNYFQVVSCPAKLNIIGATTDDFKTVKYIRASMREGEMLSVDDLLDVRMEDSMRYYDVILDEYPIGLIPGKYVDIRIRFPFGQDFISIAHKRVEQINGSVLKIIFSEQDIYTYNSMLTDKILYQAQLYVVEYIDTGAQQAADQFYPLNYNQQELLLKNPNALNIVREEMRLNRELLEAEMLDIEPKDLAAKKTHYQNLQSQLAGLRSGNSGEINGQQSLFIQRWEAQQRAIAAGEDGKNEFDYEYDYRNFGPVR